MSGGVDSAFAACLLRDRGFHVEALYLRLMDDEYSDAACRSARNISRKMGIGFHELDYSTVFRDNIIRYFVETYGRGLTPNPCVLCNPQIKVAAGMEVMRRMGFSRLATGHYARIVPDQYGSGCCLCRGRDRNKEQSYFLHGLNREVLKYLVFPLGDMLKNDVIRESYRLGIASLTEAESQDVCFLRGDYRSFLEECDIIEKGPGDMLTLAGERVGRHTGLQNYTVGQRKGLGLPGPDPSYVIRVDMAGNCLVVGPEDALYSRILKVHKVNWLVPEDTRSEEFPCEVKIRYGHSPAAARLSVDHEHVLLEFDEPQRAATPGQFAVFYDGDIVLGGGEICA